MNVSLTPELEKFVREKVATGLYNNSSEVVREALRLLYEKVGRSSAPTVEDVARSIRRIEPQLRAQGIKSLSLFGSVARGEATPESDVDVLIDVDPKAAFGLVEQAGAQIDLEKALGRRVDVVLRKSLRQELRKQALADSVKVF